MLIPRGMLRTKKLAPPPTTKNIIMNRNIQVIPLIRFFRRLREQAAAVDAIGPAPIPKAEVLLGGIAVVTFPAAVAPLKRIVSVYSAGPSPSR